MLSSLRRFFARLIAGIISLVTLRLVEVNPSGQATATDPKRDGHEPGQLHLGPPRDL